MLSGLMQTGLAFQWLERKLAEEVPFAGRPS